MYLAPFNHATPQLTDAIYIGLGRVLTISGRTIQDGAQLDPSLSQDALKAVQAVLDKVGMWGRGRHRGRGGACLSAGGCGRAV